MQDTAGGASAAAPGQTEPAAHLYRQSLDGCLDATIGRHGLSKLLLDRYLTRAEPLLGQLQDNYRTGRLPLLTIPEETADLAEAEAALARLSAGARTLVCFGTGGSSLGGETLAQLGGWYIPGVAEPDQDKRPRTRFLRQPRRPYAGACARAPRSRRRVSSSPPSRAAPPRRWRRRSPRSRR